MLYGLQTRETTTVVLINFESLHQAPALHSLFWKKKIISCCCKIKKTDVTHIICHFINSSYHKLFKEVVCAISSRFRFITGEITMNIAGKLNDSPKLCGLSDLAVNLEIL